MEFAHEIFTFIETYGYLAVFIGGVFEGEVILLLAGLLGQQTDLSFPLILTWAFLGSVSADIGWFLLGKYGGTHVLLRLPFIARLVKMPIRIAGHKPRTLSLFMRFMYGFRTIVPFSIGMSGLSSKTFFVWNALGGILWTTVFGGIGFLLGAAIEPIFGRIKHFDLLLIIVVILVFALLHNLAGAAKIKLKKIADEAEPSDGV